MAYTAPALPVTMESTDQPARPSNCVMLLEELQDIPVRFQNSPIGELSDFNLSVV